VPKIGKSAYLAHTFEHRYYIRDTVQKAVEELGIFTRNPFYERDGSTKRAEVKMADEMVAKGLDPREAIKWSSMVQRKSRLIVTRDLKMIDKSDMVIAYLTDMTIGTICEIFYCGVIRERPVYLITQNEKIRVHPWINHACRKGKIVSSLEELIPILKKRNHI